MAETARRGPSLPGITAPVLAAIVAFVFARAFQRPTYAGARPQPKPFAFDPTKAAVEADALLTEDPLEVVYRRVKEAGAPSPTELWDFLGIGPGTKDEAARKDGHEARSLALI